MTDPDINLKGRRHVRALILATGAACALAFGATPAHAAACHGASAQPGQAGTKALAATTLCLINVQRRSHGLPALRLNARLSRAAQRHSSDMVQQHFFAHTAPSGSSVVDRVRGAGYLDGTQSWTVGENIEWGGLSRSTPAGAVKSWMGSPRHRANILRRAFREIGIGVAIGGPDTGITPAATYTTDFGVKTT